MTVVYEWDCETVADGDSLNFEDGEVIDHYHAETYKEVAARAATSPDAGCRHEIVLVRDDNEGRSWASAEDAKLPLCFTDANGADGAKVPKRFVREMAQ